MKDIQGRLHGKVAIVTGAGSRGPGIGNGKAAAVLLAQEGANVVLVDSVLSRAEETLSIINNDQGNAIAIEADVTSAKDCERIVANTIDQYGRLDILDNNVGTSSRGTVVTFSEADWDTIIAINLKSMILTSKYAIPRMKESGGGSIINISSIAGLRSHNETPYSVTKGAVIALTFSMAADHAQDNIRVNCIAPGLVYTPMVANRISDQGRYLRRKSSPLTNEGTAWDVGWAVVYLASDESKWVTGIVMPVDGGLITTAPASYQWGESIDA